MKSHRFSHLINGIVLAASLTSLNLNAAESATELLTRAGAEYQRGAVKEAEELAGQAIKMEPANPRGYMMRAMLFESKGDWEKAVGDFSEVLKLKPDESAVWQHRGCDQFRLGRIKESIADFDKYLELKPDEAPYHWQRGISLYYAKRYEDGQRQFESHKTVNPNDVENAVWHFLCVAKMAGVEKARDTLIGIERDRRFPMMQIHAMFAEKTKPEAILAALGEGEPKNGEDRMAHFYAHLYIGLYYEAQGKTELAKKHINIAAEKFSGPDYMGDVARVHAKLLK